VVLDRDTALLGERLDAGRAAELAVWSPDPGDSRVEHLRGPVRHGCDGAAREPWTGATGDVCPGSKAAENR
jgi:hypothetical protein